MSFPTWPPDINNTTKSVFKDTIIDGQVDVSGTLYNRTGIVIIGDSANPDFDPSSNGITLNTTRVCLGKDSSVTGDNGIAIGNSAITGLQENSVSIGYNSIVDASNSIAIGPDASANGLNSIALGYNSGTNIYTNSVAIGANSAATESNQISIGTTSSSYVFSGLINNLTKCSLSSSITGLSNTENTLVFDTIDNNGILSYNTSNGRFTNGSGRTLVIFVSVGINYNSIAASTSDYKSVSILLNGTTIMIHRSIVQPSTNDLVSISYVGSIAPSQYLEISVSTTTDTNWGIGTFYTFCNILSL